MQSKNHDLLTKCKLVNMWNVDESSCFNSQAYKVLVPNKNEHSISSKSAFEPHITGMFCFNAAGIRLDPFIILPGLVKNPPELSQMNAFFCTQSSGWMTRQLFAIFCIYFVSKVSAYKEVLPESSEPVVLTVENHSSRIISYAIEYLAMHNIALLTFPPHCSHVLQPFDVAAARSLKSSMAKY